MTNMLSRFATEQQKKQLTAMQTQSLRIWYGKQPALLDTSLAIPRSKITSIIGPSGCGKSSFLAALNRMTDLIANCKTTGDTLLDGQSIYDPSINVLNLRKTVGMIFQKPNPFPISIEKNITLALKEHGEKNRTMRKQIMEESLKNVGLWDEVSDRLRRPAAQLSGGQQQRLCIARALALQPEVLLMDEPCSALDPIAGGVIEDLIQSLRGKVTIVIVTHNLSQAKRVADRTALFWSDGSGGRLVEEGATQTIFDHPQDAITKAYISGKRG